MNRDRVLSIAAGFMGTREGTQNHKKIVDAYNEIRPLPRRYPLKYSDHWCAGFVSAIFHLAGLDSIFPSECGCGKMIQKAKALGIWDEDDDADDVQIGDVIMYDWDDGANYARYDNKNAPDHVGIVTAVTKNHYTIIEGNYANKVKTRVIEKNGRYIRGFIKPNYPEGKEVSHTYDQIYSIALDVIRGAYGNGKTRRDLLTRAGYDATEVQHLVNKILAGDA